MRARNRLSASAVKAAIKPGSYQDGAGLMLVVKAGGSRSWILRVQVEGKRRDFGLGSAYDVSLAEAREKADALRKLCRAGIDPVEQRKAERLAKLTIPTFKVAAEQTHAEQKSGWRNTKHRGDWLSSLKLYAYPALGELRVDKIDAPAIRDVLLPIWLAKPETARRVRQRIRAIMAWAASKGYRPALDMSVMDAGLPKQPKKDRHFAAMPWEAVPAFYRTLAAKSETVGRMALMFTIATAARSGEVRGATWREVDLEAAVWTIPGERMKAGKQHIVPLSAPALAILKRMAEMQSGKPDAPIFPGKQGQPLSDMSLTKIMRDMDISDTVHGFRSAFKDWASEATHFPDAVSEAALAHVDKDKTRAAYRRSDFFNLRKDLMAAWATYLTGPAGDVADLDEARRSKAAKSAA